MPRLNLDRETQMAKYFFKKIIITILRLEAKLILRKFKPKIIAITGTVGKTSTKEAIFLAVSGGFLTRKSEKSYNSEFGVPLTVIGAASGWNNIFSWLLVIIKGIKVILSKGKYPEFLVLEFGVDRPKDMERTISLARPSVGIVTALSGVPVHVEYFQGPEDLAEEKGKLIESLDENGWAVLNGDDNAALSLRKKTKARVITYGFGDSLDITASNYKMNKEGISFKINYQGSIVPVKLPGIYGRHGAYAVLAAVGAGLSQGMNLIKMVEAVSAVKPCPGRLNLLTGKSGSFVFDDTYNSSPAALVAAIETVAEFPAQRRIAALGDMMELGRYSAEEHRKIGRLLFEKRFNLIFVVGQRAKFIAEGAIESGFSPSAIFEFSDSVEAGKAIECTLEKDDLVLVKGSQSIRMEKLTEKIMSQPELKEKLLVRQEKEWQSRQ